MRVWAGDGAVRKLADTAFDRARLAAEARVLAAVPHPGVVRVLRRLGGDPPDGLELEPVSGGTLAGLGPQPPEVVAGLGAALSTTVADLHDLGVVHGAIRPEHVLIDEGGRPLLCGFGHASGPARRQDQADARRQDVRALAAMLKVLLLPASESEPGEIRALRALLSRSEGKSMRRRGPDARWLARRLVQTVPGSRLPGEPATPGWPSSSSAAPLRPAGTPTTRRAGRAGGDRCGVAVPGWLRRRRVAAAAAVAALLLVVGVALLRGHPAPAASGQGAGGHECGGGPNSCALSPVITFGSARYRLAGPTRPGIVVVGNWDCSPVPLPVVVYTDSGQVWLFQSWPGAGSPTVGTLAGVVPGAQQAHAVGVSPGCDALQVGRPGGSVVQISLAPPKVDMGNRP